MNSLSARPTARLFPSIWKLIRLRLQLNWNAFKHAKTGRKIGTIVLVILALAFTGFIFFLSWLLLGFLRSSKLTRYVGFDAAPFLQSVPVLIFALLFLGILFSSFGVLLQALYLSGDMDFLLTSPVPIRAVFVTKLLQAVLPSFGLAALFGLPVLYGLGLSQHYNILYYPLVLLTMVALTLAAAGISALLVMLVARLFPPRRVAEVLGFLTATLSILCSQSGNLYNTLGHNVTISGSQINGAFALLMRFNTPWNPLDWAGAGLVDLGEGRWLAALGLVALTLGLAALAFSFALITAERWYYSGWAGMQVVAYKKRSARPARLNAVTAPPESGAASLAGAQMRRLLPAPIRAIVQKDFLLLRRDIRNMSQLVTPLIFGIFYSVMFLRPGHALFPDSPDMPVIFSTISHIIASYGSIARPAGRHGLLVGGQELLDVEGLPGSSRAPADCQVPGSLPANAGAGHGLHGGGLDPAKSLASHVHIWPAGNQHVPGRDERHPARLRRSRRQLQLDRPAPDECRRHRLSGPGPGRPVPTHRIRFFHRPAAVGGNIQLAADLRLSGRSHGRYRR
jgi:hypothetical protein